MQDRKQVDTLTTDEFAATVTAMTGTLYRVSCTILEQEADREDAVQEAICRAWEQKGRLKHPQFFQTWLIRILINECYGLVRKRKRIVYMDDLPESSDLEPDKEDSMDLTDAVSALDEKLRLPLILHYAEGYSVGEIAGILDLSESAVKMRLLRARNTLRDRLNEEAEIT